MIRAVIFDYGNVISVVDPEMFLHAVKPFAVGSASPAERWDRTRELLVAYESGTMGTDLFIPRFLDAAGLAMSHEEFITAWSSFFRPIPFTRDLIRTLSARYTVALLSNTNPLHFDHVIRATDIFPLFQAVTLSYVAGAMKPATVIYQDMLRRLNLPAETCLYLDDLQENVDAAEALGMHGIRFTSPDEVRRRLLAYLPENHL